MVEFKKYILEKHPKIFDPPRQNFHTPLLEVMGDKVKIRVLGQNGHFKAKNRQISENQVFSKLAYFSPDWGHGL